MAGKGIRLSKIAREFNVGISTIVEFLNKKGYEVDSNPNTKVTEEILEILTEEYSSDISVKKESALLSLNNLRENKDTISIHDIDQQRPVKQDPEEEVLIKDPTASGKIILPEEETEIKVVGKVDLEAIKGKGKKKAVPAKEVEAKTEDPGETNKKAAEEPETKTEGKDINSVRRYKQGICRDASERDEI